MKSLVEFLKESCKDGSSQDASPLNIKNMEGTLSKTVDNDEENNSKNNPEKSPKPTKDELPEQKRLKAGFEKK